MPLKIKNLLWSTSKLTHTKIKNINNFTQWKNGSVDVKITRAITHQKHPKQFGRSTQSAVDIFNTLRV